MNIDTSKVHIEVDEVLRYMGIGPSGRKAEDGGNLRSEVKSLSEAVIKAVKPKYLYKSITITNGTAERSRLTFEGTSISKFLGGIDEAALLVVTLGHEYEQLVKNQAYMGSSKTNLMIDAIGTELVEKCADLAEDEIRENLGKCKSSRFSPGYGDFGLQFQKTLLDYLEAHKIGVFCNEHCMMFPQKSVTAVVKFEESEKGCRQCGKYDCKYRK